MARLYRDGRLERTDLDPASVSDFVQDPRALIWLDVEAPTEADMRVLAEELGFHELALEDCIHPHQRPKIEGYDSYFFLVLYAVELEGGRLAEHEIAAFAGRNYLVTVRKEPPADLAPMVERWESRAELAAQGGGYLLYVLLDEIVDRYFDALDGYEDRVEELQERLYSGEAEPEAQAELHLLRRDLFRFRRMVGPLRDVLDAIQRRGIAVVTEALEPYYRDVYDHVLRVIDFVDTARDALSSAMEAHLSVVSNRLNQVMKRLTAWASIILVPTLVAGIYGMNFRHMPELDWRWGYGFALGAMGASAAGLWAYFKRKDYF